MTFSKFVSIGLFALALGVSQAAHATPVIVTLNLNSLATGTFSGALSVDGFLLTARGLDSSLPAIVNVGGTNTLQSSNHGTAQGADTFLTKVGGGAFTLVSVEMAANNPGANYGIGISNTAGGPHSSAVWGGSVFASHSDYMGNLTSTFQTYNFAALGLTGFLNATQFDLDPVDSGAIYALRSITVSYEPAVAVPAPGALALLGLGLFGLGRLRRKTKAA